MLGLRRLPSGQILPVLSSSGIVFGRDGSGCDVVLSHPSAARKHFEITFEDRYLQVRDLGSSSGTFINGGERVQEDTPRRVRPGDTITYGMSSATHEAFMVIDCPVDERTFKNAREKILRLQIESERIRSKEGAEGLTSGQERVLEKNQHEIRALERSITELVNQQSADSSARNAPDDAFWDASIAAEDDDDHINYVDLTDRRSSTSAAVVQTYDSLVARLGELDQESSRLETQISALTEQEQQQANDEDEADELDKFMAANENDIKSSDLDKARKKLRDVQDERSRCEALAEIARPALVPPRQPTSKKSSSDVIGVAANTTSAAAAVPSTIPTINKSKVDDIFSRPSSKHKPPPAMKFRIVQDDSVNTLREGKRQKYGDEEQEDEASATTWRPPTGQRGDGKTLGNDRFGY